MVARGDLGVQVPYEEIPNIQSALIAKCNKAGKPGDYCDTYVEFND